MRGMEGLGPATGGSKDLSGLMKMIQEVASGSPPSDGGGKGGGGKQASGGDGGAAAGPVQDILKNFHLTG